eukprot:COSAG06_NODE_1167_length_10451_cov_16.691654_8_plen_87_part_00
MRHHACVIMRHHACVVSPPRGTVCLGAHGQVETETITVYNAYSDPLVGAPITKMTEVHKNNQTIHNGNIVETPMYENGKGKMGRVF